MEYKEHYSVLKDECISQFREVQKLQSENEQTELLFADLTFGAGGHSFAILEEIENSKVYATDQDPEAIENGTKQIEAKQLQSKLDLMHINFEEFAHKMSTNLSFEGLDGILIDLGVSSHHFDKPDRGFSYRFDAPLDMRMNPNSGDPSAADLLRDLSEEELIKIFQDYGEEKLSTRIAEKICEQRKTAPIKTTGELENLIFHCYPKKWRHGKTNPSTRVFQALRIAVNRELDVLTRALCELPPLLRPGGRLCIISFHSLEDRLVKHYFRRIARKEIELTGEYKVLTKKPILPSTKELEENNRSRSAKLRVLQRLS